MQPTTNFEKVIAVAIITPVKINANVENKENVETVEVKPDPPTKALPVPGKSDLDPPAKAVPGKSTLPTTDLEVKETLPWNVNEDVLSILGKAVPAFPDDPNAWTLPVKIGGENDPNDNVGLSVSFPDFAAFLRGMEMNSSSNLADVLNTTGFSSFFAYPEDKIIVPVKLVADDSNQEEQPVVDLNQEEKSLVDANQEEKPVVDMNQEEQPAVEANKEEKSLVGSNQEEQLAIDPNQNEKSLVDPSEEEKLALDLNQEFLTQVEHQDEQLVLENPVVDLKQEAKPVIEEDNPFADLNEDEESVPDLGKAEKLELLLDMGKEEKRVLDLGKEKKPAFDLGKEKKLVLDLTQLDALVAMATPDMKKQAKSNAAPALTPVSESSESESDQEVSTGGSESPSPHSYNQDETIRIQNGVEARRKCTSTDAVNEDDLVNEAYNSMNVSILSFSEIFEDDEASEISNLTPEVMAEEGGPVYSNKALGTSFESAASAPIRNNRSMFGDWAAEVNSIEVSLEAGKFTLRKVGNPGEDTCVAQQGYFNTRAEYMPRFTVQMPEIEIDGPKDEMEADKEAADYYVKAEWNEFVPATLFSSSCNRGEAFTLTDYCSGKKWVISS